MAMRTLSLTSFCSLLLLSAACGSSGTSEPGGEVDSQADVQNLFESIMPDLVEAFGDLADELSASALPSSVDKGGARTSTIQCPGGGTLTVDLNSGESMLVECGVGGVVISAALYMFVSHVGGTTYQATFNGTLMVTGTFTGTIEVNSALVQWEDPPSQDTTFWDVTVTVNGSVFIASSSDPDPGNGMNGGSCDSCIGINAAPPNFPTNNAVSCEGPVDQFSCECMTESGETLFFYLSEVGCIY